MKTSILYISKSFTKGFIALLFLAIAILLIVINANAFGLVIGLLLIAAGVMAIVGSVQAVRGIREKRTMKFVIAFLLNFGITILFIWLLATNILDLVNAFG